MPHFDTLILGAGAAGLFCASRVAARGRRVLVIDHAKKPAEKVRISGGGRCNFTNLDTQPEAFLSDNPHFAKSALARYTPQDFCQLMSEHSLTWHEKTLGQLFCDQKSGAVISLLLRELERYGGHLQLNLGVGEIKHVDDRFLVDTAAGVFTSDSLVVATGGLSIPKMGATGLAYRIAEQFGHSLITTRPALVPLTFSGAQKQHFSDLSGVSIPVSCQAEAGPSFAENLLFTHRGLSGPAVLQASSYWRESQSVELNLLPDHAAQEILNQARQSQARQTVKSVLKDYLPARLTEKLSPLTGLPFDKNLAELSNSLMAELSHCLHHWSCLPAGSEGYRTAEVTLGGVATDALSSRTMESQHQTGLFFIGECVDVTGWLGGYNFQWAWASAAAAGAVA